METSCAQVLGPAAAPFPQRCPADASRRLACGEPPIAAAGSAEGCAGEGLGGAGPVCGGPVMRRPLTPMGGWDDEGWWRMGMGEQVFVAVLGFSDIEFHWWSQTKSDCWFEGTETWMFKPKNNGSVHLWPPSPRLLDNVSITVGWQWKLRVFQDFSMKHLQQSPWISLWFDCQGVNFHFSSSTTIYLWLNKQLLVKRHHFSWEKAPFLLL